MPDEPSGVNAEGGEQPSKNVSDDAIKAAIKEALEGNEGYKGLQRAYAKSEREWGQKLSAKDAESAALRDQVSGLSDGFSFLNEKLMSILPDDEREKITRELSAKQIASLSKQVQELRTPRQPSFTEPAYDPDSDPILQKLRADALESLQETAQDRGLDPKDPRLDYGDVTESFPARLKKLNASAKKAAKEDDDKAADSVSPRVPMTPTRETNAGTPDQNFGKGLYERGAEEVMERLRREAFGKK